MNVSDSGHRDRLRGAGHAAVLVAAWSFLGAGEPPAGTPPPPVEPPAAQAEVPPPQIYETTAPRAPPANDVAEIVVEAPEPRYVAPTRRDKIGRIWAPVLINGKGPFRLVLDTGASHSAVTAEVAHDLGLPLLESNQMMLRGVTGSRAVPAIPVDSLIFGDLEVRPHRLPIVTDALGGAEGVLGAEGLADKRILIDFRHDRISIKKSHGERADPGMVSVPFKLVGGLLTVVDARIGDVHAKAIIDTGGQVTIGNPRLAAELLRQYREGAGADDLITGATDDVQKAHRVRAPPIVLGGLTLSEVRVTIADLYIFQYWHMTHEPVLLIGMDLLGLLDTLVIDYRRGELHIRLR